MHLFLRILQSLKASGQSTKVTDRKSVNMVLIRLVSSTCPFHLHIDLDIREDLSREILEPKAILENHHFVNHLFWPPCVIDIWYMVYFAMIFRICRKLIRNQHPPQNSDCKKRSTAVFCFPSNRPMFQSRSRRACYGKNSAGNRISNCPGY